MTRTPTPHADIREEFARIAESRRKPPVSASNIGYNCAIDEMIALLRAGDAPVSARAEVQAPLNSDGDTLASLADEIASAESRSIMGMPVVTITLSVANRDHIVTALRSPRASVESIRNAIAAMERVAAQEKLLGSLPDGVAIGLVGSEEQVLRAGDIRKLALSLAALKREVGI